MGNEASMEGGEQPGETGSGISTAGAPGSISAPAGSGQLIKPSNGVAVGGGAAAGPTAGINGLSGRPNQINPVASPKPSSQAGYADSRTGGGGHTEPYRLAAHDNPREQKTQGPGQGQGQGQGPHHSLHVDTSVGSGKSPSVSPCTTPTSPYSVPQIAPMPSSKVCPLCKTTDLTVLHNQPNFNTCTQCRSTVCNQCGFNPNPHLTEVQEWLCLNCQMQRALGIDMITTPQSKSQQQIHSPSHQAKPQPQPQPQTQAKPQAQPSQPASGQQKQAGPTSVSQTGPHEGPVPHQPKSEQSPQRGPSNQGQANQEPPGSRVPQGMAPSQSLAKPDQNRGVGSSPARAPGGPQEPAQDGITGKLFGFGASLLNQASTLISADPQPTASPQPSPAKVASRVVFSDASSASAPKAQAPPAAATQGKPGSSPAQQQQQQKPQQQQHQAPQQKTQHQPEQQQARQEPAPKPKEPENPKVTCPLCKTELNVGSGQPPNYNSCTQCHIQVCNLCGFNPTPHLVQVRESGFLSSLATVCLAALGSPKFQRFVPKCRDKKIESLGSKGQPT
ncbi:protein bassoon-like [Polyodon spathula]|uniref:protein bassoon-like n=1 Tax=Polyodon spathula TaxID=7913 RepID=UPI001B7E69C9|nr:protein bassoon-like [Polyodon spathula]